MGFKKSQLGEKVEIQVSRGCGFGKLLNQRDLGTRMEIEPEHNCCASVPWIQSYLSSSYIKLGGGLHPHVEATSTPTTRRGKSQGVDRVTECHMEADGQSKE